MRLAPFDAGAFEAARQSGLGTPLEIHTVATSTNDLARAGWRAGAPAGATWLAEEQTAGRGRQGRTWSCARYAGLLVSFVVESTLEPDARPTLLPLALGLGVCEALRSSTGLDIRTKWPNDLWLGDRKVAGVLVEAVEARHAIVGLGVNVHPTATEGLAATQATTQAAALGDAVRVPSREILLAAILAAVERRHADWRAARFAALLDAYVAGERTMGRSVRALIGDAVIEGQVCGVTEAGLLRVATSAGTERCLVAGEVHLL